MARSKQSHHVVISDSAGGSKIGLKLLHDQNGSLAYTWKLQPEQVWKQRNWWNGALQFYYNPQVPDVYGLADSVWAPTENELSLGPRIQPATFGVRSGGAEPNTTNRFTATGATLATTTTAGKVYNGIYAYEVTGADATDTVDTENLPNSTRYRSRAIRATVYARIPSGAAAITLSIREDGTSTANSGSITLTTTFQRITANVTVGAAINNIVLRITVDSGTSATFEFDELTIEDSSTVANQIFPSFHFMSVSSVDTLVHVTSNAVWTWDETDDYWVIAFWSANAITGARVWDNRMFIGHGTAVAYQYSDAADPTVFTASTLTDTTAQLFAMGRTAFAETYALFQTDTPDVMKVTVNPVNGGTQWGAAIEVGFNDRAITGIYEAFGEVYVGKGDGLYAYATSDYDTNYQGMTNVATGLQYTVGDSNFNRGAFHQGWLYLKVGELGLWRYNQSNWEDISGIIQSPAFTEMAGSITSIGSDGAWLYVVVEDRVAAATTKTSWILMCREHPEGWEVHTLANVVLNAAFGWGTLNNSTSNFVYFAGDVSTQHITYRIWKGNKSTTPRLALNNGLELTGTLITSYLELPQKMTANRLQLTSEALTADLAVTAAYMLDNETSYTNINSTDAQFNTSPAETIAFNSGVSGRRIRLRLTLDSNSLTSSPIVKTFNLYFTRLKEWTLVAYLADNALQLQGVPGGMAAERMIATLDTLRAVAGTSPLQFEDLDGTTQRVFIAEMQEIQFAIKGSTAGVPVYERGLQLVLREAVA